MNKQQKRAEIALLSNELLGVCEHASNTAMKITDDPDLRRELLAIRDRVYTEYMIAHRMYEKVWSDK